MITENKKALQIRVQLSPSPCYIIFINHEHDSDWSPAMSPPVYIPKVSIPKSILYVPKVPVHHSGNILKRDLFIFEAHGQNGWMMWTFPFESFFNEYKLASLLNFVTRCCMCYEIPWKGKCQPQNLTRN